MPASRRLTSELECKITDFGLSSELSQTHSLAKTLVGTPYYMAPEVFRREPYGAPADVWSFGVMAFELLALKRPFGGKSFEELGAHVVDGKFDASAALSGCGHPAALTELAGALLQLVPSQRIALETMLSRLEEIPRAVLFVAEPCAAAVAGGSAISRTPTPGRFAGQGRGKEQTRRDPPPATPSSVTATLGPLVPSGWGEGRCRAQLSGSSTSSGNSSLGGGGGGGAGLRHSYSPV